MLEQAGREKGGGHWAPEGAAYPQASPGITGLDGIGQGAWPKRSSPAGPEDKNMLRLDAGSAHLCAMTPGVAQKLVRATQAPGIIPLTPLPSSVPMIPALDLRTCLGATLGKKLSQGHLLNISMDLKAFSFENEFFLDSWEDRGWPALKGRVLVESLF